MFYMVTSEVPLLLYLQQLSTENGWGSDTSFLQSKSFTFYKLQIQKSLQQISLNWYQIWSYLHFIQAKIKIPVVLSILSFSITTHYSYLREGKSRKFGFVVSSYLCILC